MKFTIQKTAGMNEQEIIELVSSVAVRLSQLGAGDKGEASLSKARVFARNEVYKSYGV